MVLHQITLINILKTLFYMLKAHATMPYMKIRGKYKFSYLYFAISFGAHVFLTGLGLWIIHSAFVASTANFSETVHNVWEMSFWIMNLTFRWSFFLNTKKFHPILRFVCSPNRNAARDPFYTVFFFITSIVIYYNSVLWGWKEIVRQYLLISIINSALCLLLHPTIIFMLFYFKTFMKQVTADIVQAVTVLESCSGVNNPGCVGLENKFSLQKFQNSKLDHQKHVENVAYCTINDVTNVARGKLEDSMEFSQPISSSSPMVKNQTLLLCDIERNLKQIRKVICSMYDIFSLPVLMLIFTQGVNLVAQCEEGSRQVRKLCAAIGMNVVTRQQLKKIQIELEQMPRFKILGLFDLDRRCLLSIISTALTYVIILVQFQQNSDASSGKK
ncbi:Gustatory receptor 84 [Hyalella azteca]|uniref:Gustatory receptor 84 n=1 Tax=Hyalella azteca TaxID=294128 RepID=A0A6A0H8N6_HYAAZ|nr:Gustatory receptor 84 [Hyalella azteca]